MEAIKGTITKRLDDALDGLHNDFKALYTIEDFENKLKALNQAGSQSDRPSKLRKLCDMFDICKIPYERGKDNVYYEKIVKNSNIPTFSEIEDRILYTLFTHYGQYPAPEDYMKRMVDRLSFEGDGWAEDSLRLRILKQFIKYGNYLEDAGVEGKKVIHAYVGAKLGTEGEMDEDAILENIDDGVFDEMLREEDIDNESLDYIRARERKKARKKRYKLLKAANDLATGKFRTAGSTKKNLYLFAMVYGMTYYSGNAKSGEIVDYETDIEKNLFLDYYTNNLVQFIFQDYRDKLCEYELDPSGQGINYKNYAEMIYLYYINKNISPQEKLRRSSEMIKRVQKQQSEMGRTKVDTKERNTAYYRKFPFMRNDIGNGLYSEDILCLAESDFEDFICKYYNCDKSIDNYLQVEIEQNSAFEVYSSILQELCDLKMPLDNCNYGLWFTDIAAFEKKGLKNIYGRRKDISREGFGEFRELLLGLNRFMGYTVFEEPSEQNENQEHREPLKMKIKALDVSTPKTVTRTSVIVAFYYYYNVFCEDCEVQWKSFEELFNDFKELIDVELEKAYYQPLSGKNLFDILVVFSSYVYLNK